ncbi:hypothetical protein ACGF07_29010 [Kitasatospora sp. NPDC048194]|uniref:hypothetical protein n=1 Tax=Kitasatospora sp. NPDC048194 TaxID=3364045 RepID=UPI00371CE987
MFGTALLESLDLTDLLAPAGDQDPDLTIVDLDHPAAGRAQLCVCFSTDGL